MSPFWLSRISIRCSSFLVESEEGRCCDDDDDDDEENICGIIKSDANLDYIDIELLGEVVSPLKQDHPKLRQP